MKSKENSNILYIINLISNAEINKVELGVYENKDLNDN